MKFYRKPWTKEKLDLLIKIWPELGTRLTAQQLNLTNQQIKSKVDRLKLFQKPKVERLCVCCGINLQVKRSYGVKCRSCYLKHRNLQRRNKPKPRKQWMNELLRTVRYRSKEPCNITIDYLLNLWGKQSGKCFYSNISLNEPVFYGRGRSYKIASLDRIDSTRGYVTGNVVWCCWGCNSAKLDFTLKDYISLCEQIAQNKYSILEKSYVLSQELPSKNSIMISP